MAQDDVLTEESSVDESAVVDDALRGTQDDTLAEASASTDMSEEEQTPTSEVEAGDENEAAQPEAEVVAAQTVQATGAEEADMEAETEEASAAEPQPDEEVEAEPDAEEMAYDALIPLEEIPDNAAWYVVHTYSGYENKVKRNLEYRVESTGMQHQIFRIVVPVEEEVDIKEGQRRVVERRVFPGYVFVQMLMDDEAWHLVHNTPGVTSFVGSGTKPTPLRDAEVERILRRIEAEEPTVRVSFREGQRVRIVDGPFSDFHGVVDEIDMERGKVRLLVSFFGRETPVELDLLQVEKG